VTLGGFRSFKGRSSCTSFPHRFAGCGCWPFREGFFRLPFPTPNCVAPLLPDESFSSCGPLRSPEVVRGYFYVPAPGVPGSRLAVGGTGTALPLPWVCLLPGAASSGHWKNLFPGTRAHVPPPWVFPGTRISVCSICRPPLRDFCPFHPPGQNPSTGGRPWCVSTTGGSLAGFTLPLTAHSHPQDTPAPFCERIGCVYSRAFSPSADVLARFALALSTFLRVGRSPTAFLIFVEGPRSVLVSRLAPVCNQLFPGFLPASHICKLVFGKRAPVFRFSVFFLSRKNPFVRPSSFVRSCFSSPFYSDLWADPLPVALPFKVEKLTSSSVREGGVAAFDPFAFPSRSGVCHTTPPCPRFCPGFFLRRIPGFFSGPDAVPSSPSFRHVTPRRSTLVSVMLSARSGFLE